MTEPPERTPEEREAARIARERRRGGVFGESGEPGFESGFVDWSQSEPAGGRAPEPAGETGAMAHEPGPMAHEPEPMAHEPEPMAHEPEPMAYEPEPMTAEHAVPAGPEVPEPVTGGEVPSGTRRVSRGPVRERPTRSANRPPARPPARPAPSGRPPRGPRRTGSAVDGRPRRRHSWIGRIVALVIAAIVIVAAVFAVEMFQLLGTSPHGRVTVVVPPKSGTHQIGNLLARDGVIPSGFFFELRASLAGDRGKLRSGTYTLQQGMSYGAVLTALTTAPKAAPTTTLTIAEGHTRQYVAKLLRRQHIRGNYLALTRRSRLLDPAAYGAPRSTDTLEGFLFPDTFQLLDPVRASALVADQLRDFKQRFSQINLGYARSKNLTPYDVVKIASLIEAEAASEHDRPLVASVIYNRLHDGMMLQFDSTTRYATGNFTGPLLESQLHSLSPYNTHTHLGLPPTPIDSPGLASLQAAAHPAQTNYTFFFTKPCNEGGSVFATNYPEFQYLLAKYHRSHC